MNPSDLGLSPLALRLVDPASPVPLRLLAARGVAPALPPAQAFLVALVLRADEQEGVRSAATAFVAAPPKAVVDATLDGLATAAAARAVAESLALDADRATRLFRSAAADDATRAVVVQRAPADALVQLASIDAVLASSPRALLALASDLRATAAVRARCEEIAAAQGMVLARAIAEPEAPAATPSAASDDASREPEACAPLEDDAAVDEAIGAIAASLASAAAATTTSPNPGADGDDEAEEKRVLPLSKFLETLSVSQKIRRATIGSGEERAILVRDTNRLVAEAAITSPRIQENEVVRIAANRSVSSDVLRRIGESREWMKSYAVKVVLVQNPRLPLPLALRLLPMLRESDLKRVATSRSVAGAVAAAAKREMQKKQ